MTTQTLSLAKPYATAAFECALAKHDLAGWQAMLDQAAFIALDVDLKNVMARVDRNQETVIGLFCDLLKTLLNQEKMNFIRLLGENQRLILLPDIAHLF